MCGIAGQISLSGRPIEDLESRLNTMSHLLSHRGPDGDGIWIRNQKNVGFTHRRLSIIDLSTSAAQPMRASNGNVLTFNGEIYNYLELRATLKKNWAFLSESDSECILASYQAWGGKFLDELRGMYAFGIWDEASQVLVCSRDRFGIKPFYYAVVDDVFMFASEAKALVPFLDSVRVNSSSLAEYLTFQYNIGDATLIEGISQLKPGHRITVVSGEVHVDKYWDLKYEIDFDHTETYFHDKIQEVIAESVSLHCRSDVPIGSYVSGGIDSSLIHRLSQGEAAASGIGFHGRFTDFPGYDESGFAKSATNGGRLEVRDITSGDFLSHIESLIYHLDYPVAGPGSFPQYMVSEMAAEHVKVVLGGQGGDEIFGGYARYVIAYMEQCLKAAIDGTYKGNNYVVTLESIIPNLGLLREYKPLIKRFWRDGLFESMDNRYFSLVNRAADLEDYIDWEVLDLAKVSQDFKTIFNNEDNVGKEAYFDKMTHFDFKCLLPALLQVEDRVSMAHGLESRVPFLDHKVLELSATIPADVKFKDGNMKHVLKRVFEKEIPSRILNRRDKMGFPVPLKEWLTGDLREFYGDTMSSLASRNLPFLKSKDLTKTIVDGGQFSRGTWALLSLEIWHQQYIDSKYRWAR